MLVSIVVPVRDALEDLRGMLGALAAQAPGAPAFEVIVADDGSATPIPAEVAPPGMDVRVLRLEPRGAYPARNAALDVARGDVVAFTDADCRPVPGWLALSVLLFPVGSAAALLLLSGIRQARHQAPMPA